MYIRRLLIGLASFATLATGSVLQAQDSPSPNASSSDIIPYPFGAPPKPVEAPITPPLPKPELPSSTTAEEKKPVAKEEEKKQAEEKPAASTTTTPAEVPAEPEKKAAETIAPPKLPEPATEQAKTEVLNTAPKSEEQKSELPNPKPLPEPDTPSVTEKLPAPVTPEVLKEASKPDAEPAPNTAQPKPAAPAEPSKPATVEATTAPVTPEVLKEASKPSAEPTEAKPAALPVESEKPVVAQEPAPSSPEPKPAEAKAAASEPSTPVVPEAFKKAAPETKPAEASASTKESATPVTPEVLKKAESEPKTQTEAKPEPVKKEVISSPEPVTVIKKTVMEEPKKEQPKAEAAAETTEPKPEAVKPKTKSKKKKSSRPEPRFKETIISPAATAGTSPQATPSNVPPPAFTPETKQVFDVIESSLAKNAPAPLTGKVAVAHDDYVTSLSEFKNPETENIGIKVQVKKSDEDIAKLLNSGYNALMLGQYETAIALYKEVLKSDSDNQNALGGLAAAYQKSGELAQAKTIYGKLLSLYPENEEGINNFLSLAAEEAPLETLAKLREMERVNPRYSVIPAQIAMINAKLGNTEEASRYLKRAISLAPDNTSYRYNLAIILDRAGEKEQAMALYRQLIDAYQKGSQIPGNIKDIQERLTYLGAK